MIDWQTEDETRADIETLREGIKRQERKRARLAAELARVEATIASYQSALRVAEHSLVEVAR